MTPNEYQREALRTEYTPDFIQASELGRVTSTEPPTIRPLDHKTMLARVMHGMIGIATEAGELQDAIKKHMIYGRDLDLVNVMEEVSDVLWYCALTLDAAGFTFEQAMERNIAKLRARFPDKFTSELANNRDLDAERAALEDG